MIFPRRISLFTLLTATVLISSCETEIPANLPPDLIARFGTPTPSATPSVVPTETPPTEPVCEKWEVGTATGVVCSDGSFDNYSSLDLYSSLEWNPDGSSSEELSLKWKIHFELPKTLEVRENILSATGNGWSAFDADDIRYCYKAPGNKKTNNPPEFAYAAEVSAFGSSDDCSVLEKKEGAHHPAKAGMEIIASDTLKFEAQSGTSFSEKEKAALLIVFSVKILGIDYEF